VCWIESRLVLDFGALAEKSSDQALAVVSPRHLLAHDGGASAELGPSLLSIRDCPWFLK
jgi:hypothetical protein